MEVCDVPWVDFVVRRTAPNILFVERIVRDRELWEQWMPKLEAFYMKGGLLYEGNVARVGSSTPQSNARN